VSVVEKPDAQIGLMDGAAALPRKNGEMGFAAPWEGRAFGLAVALSDERCYGWDDFRARLVDEIGRRGPDAPYYESWLAALERVLVERGLVTGEELERRTAEYASGEREDHDHDHDHDHGDHHHHH